MPFQRLASRLALLALMLIAAPACQPAPPSETAAFARASLVVVVGRTGSYQPQYLKVSDWEEAEAVLSGSSAPMVVSAAAVVDPQSGQRSATLLFSDVAPGPGYSLTIRLKRRDAQGVMQVVAAEVRSELTVLTGSNAVTLDTPAEARTEVSLPTSIEAGAYVESVPADTPPARLGTIFGILPLPDGSILMSDLSYRVVRRVTIDPEGNATVSTWAGSRASSTDDTAIFVDGAAATARFYVPRGLARDAQGRIYVVDGLNHAIRRVTVDGAYNAVSVETVAGTGQQGYQDGPGATAQFFQPRDMAMSDGGELFVSDSGNQRIRKLTFDADGKATVSTVAGDGESGWVDGPGAGARFNRPCGLAFDASGRLWIADASNNCVRLLSLDGTGVTVATAAGQRTPGNADGVGADARFAGPEAVAVGPDGDVYVGDTSNHLIRRLRFSAGDWSVTTVAGRPLVAGWVLHEDGPGLSADVRGTRDLAFDAAGTLIAATHQDWKLRRLTFDGAGLATVSTLAGDGISGYVDGRVGPEFLRGAVALIATGPGEALIAETNRVVRMSTDALGRPSITPVAGDTIRGTMDGVGTAARFNTISSMTRDEAGDLYVVDGRDMRRVALDAGGQATVTTLTGAASPAGTYTSLVYAGNRTFYLSETFRGLHRVTLDAAGNAMRVQLNAMAAGFQDGPLGTAQFRQVSQMVVDAQGALYLADRGNHAVRKLVFAADDAGTVSTVAGTGVKGYQDGPGPSAMLAGPWGLGLDADGHLLVAELDGYRVRQITFDGSGQATVSTIAGDGVQGFRDGPISAARFFGPRAVAVEEPGRLLVLEVSSVLRRVHR